MSQVSYGSITISDLTDIGDIINYYLATTYDSGVTTENGEWGNWSTSVQSISEQYPYLWNYEQILNSDEVPINTTEPHIIGTYGQQGSAGRSIMSIQDYYLATPNNNIQTIDSYILVDETETTVQPNTTYYTKNGDIYTVVENPSSSANPYTQHWYKKEYEWSPSIEIIDENNRYLWNYEHIIYTDSEEYIGPRLLGVYGNQGIQGPQGNPGDSSYTHILYAEDINGTNSSTIPTATTKYIAICVTNNIERPPDNSDLWRWKLYVGEDGAAVSQVVPLYYLKTNTNSVPPQPEDGSIENIANISVENQWTSVIPSYIEGGIYYTCLQTFLLKAEKSPIYSQFVEDLSLTDSKADINNLNIKTEHFIWNNTGAISASGNNEVFDESNPETYGYNSIAAADYFALRYNERLLNKLSQSSFEIYNPTATEQQAQIILDTNGLTLKDLQGRTVAAYGQKSIIGNPDQAHISIDPGDPDTQTPAAINFYTSKEAEENRVASMTGDYLEIARTLVFEQMQLGRNKWAWKYDDRDDSIVLKWIG